MPTTYVEGEQPQYNQQTPSAPPQTRGVDFFNGISTADEAANQRRDPYGPDVQWDQYGNPIGQRLPRLGNAVDWQFLANQKAEQRRTTLWNDAQGVMQQGQNLLSSYRPGGSAALASGIFGQRASLYAGQAASIEAPDMLMGYRQQKQEEADKESKRNTKIQQIIGGIQTAVGIAGAIAGVPTGGGGGGAMPTGPSTTPPPAPSGGGGSQGGGSPVGGGPGMVPGGGGMAPGYAGMIPGGGGGGVGMMPGGGGGGVAGAGLAPSGVGGGGGGAGAPGGGGVTAAGFGGPGGVSGGVGGKGGARGGPGPGAGAGGGGGGAGFAGGPANSAAMVGFTPEEAAGVAYNSSPVAGMVTIPEWADSPERKSSAALFMQTARARLIRAAGGYPSNGGNGAPYAPGESAMHAEAPVQAWLKAEVERLRAAESTRFDTNQYSEPNDLSILKGGR